MSLRSSLAASLLLSTWALAGCPGDDSGDTAADTHDHGAADTQDHGAADTHDHGATAGTAGTAGTADTGHGHSIDTAAGIRIYALLPEVVAPASTP